MKFEFEFTDSDFEEKGWSRPLTTFSFSVDFPFAFESIDHDEWYSNVMLEKTEDLEEYGVHNFNASSNESGEWDKFGYHSYEVNYEKWEELVNLWHDWFSELNLNPGEIEITVNQYDSEDGIFDDESEEFDDND